MKFNGFLKKISFLLAVVISFGNVACQSASSSRKQSPKYLLTGTLENTSGDFNYYSINNGTEYAVALKESALSDTGTKTILSTYNNKPVTGIWRDAFYNSKCTSVVIPSSITVIDYEAFMGSKITSVTIPASVTDIGESAFYSCKSLTKVSIQNSTTTSESSSACSCFDVVDNSSEERSYSTLKTIPSFCFFNCVALKELVLPESIEEIEYEAFHNCIALFSTLSFANIKTIRSRAFQGCRALKKVYISSSFFDKENGEFIGVIEDKAFDNCNSNLEFYLVGDSTDITSWVNLANNVNWNQKSEYTSPGNQINPDATSNSRYTYHITAAGASYTSDWIYTVDQNNNVEISSYIGPTEIEGVAVKFLSVPNELPSGSGQYVRTISTQAFETVKSSLVRLYLPTTLKRIEANMFTSAYTNLLVIDDNTSGKCSTDQNTQNLTGRIILNGITALETIGNSAFVNMAKLKSIKKLYLPYSLKAVGANAFGSTGDNKHMSGVTDFRWDYDDDLSALKVIGKQAFYKLGNTNNTGALDSGIHTDYIASNTTGAHKYELTTLVIPRTFEHFGINGDDNNAYKVGGAEEEKEPFGTSAFAGCPLLEKVVFKGSKKSYVQSTPGTADPATYNLVLASQTFIMNGSLRTVVFEERCGKSIVFHTVGGKYQPVIGWSSGKNSNDFGGDPALQTLVLPNKYTTLYFQNFAFQGNSRGAIYLSGAESTSKLKGSVTSTMYGNNGAIKKPTSNSVTYNTDSRVKEWRTIGDEDFYSNVCPGYCFASNTTDSSSSVQNAFGIDQKMPIYSNVIYKDTISVPGVSTEVEVGTGNTNEYIEDSHCAFVCGASTATMTNYLYDRHNSSFNGTATVPATVTKSNSTVCSVTKIGASAFSADYCDSTSYNNYSNYKDLTAVSLPNTITEIGEYAFFRAYGITKVSAGSDYVMPSALEKIGKHAFAFCRIEQVLNIPDGCLFYENSNDAIESSQETSVFANNFSLRKVTFGNNATSSTYYTTTTYTSNSSNTYTSAIYSTSSVAKNKSALLIVLNRNYDDNLCTSSDLASVPVQGQATNDSQFNGQYSGNYLYGAFKMCYWIDSLIVGTSLTNSSIFDQPLISGIFDTVNNNNVCKVIYLNQPYNFIGNACRLKTISFGGSNTISTPTYSFEGCENLVNIRLPRVVGGTIPAGLFAFNTSQNIRFEVPDDNTGATFKPCAAGVLDLTYTGYVGIDAEAFKNTNLTEVIAPITDEFTIEEDAFANCQNLTSFDFSNVTNTVTLNGAFRSAKIPSTLFDFGSSANIVFGTEAFKGANFSDGSFSFPAKTAIIGESCFESCPTLTTVTADANLTNLQRVLVDNASGQNNAGDPTGFKQIGDYAFYQCTNLTSFDFTKFPDLERIGHYAFGMATNSSGVTTPDAAGVTNSASICTGGVINLPATLTNLGVGAFHSSKITKVTINSSTIKFERGSSTYTASTRTSNTKGGHQFRYCASLTEVWFSNPNCAWTTPYLTKSEGDQANYFSNCGALIKINLPTNYDLQCPKFTGTSDSTRSDSMIWGSREGVQFWVHHTVNNLDSSKPAISDFFHRTANGKVAPIVFYVATSADVSKYDSSKGKYVEIRGSAVYWGYINGVATYLGQATVNATTGDVTFSSGSHTANSSGLS